MSLPVRLAEHDDADVPALASPPVSERNGHLTYVELVFCPGRIERWVRFGQVAQEHRVGSRQRFVGFEPGAVFGFVRWVCDAGGTAVTRIDILQAVRRSAPCWTVPGVAPGAEILLRLSGWPKVQKALTAIDAIEALGVDPADAAPDYWRHVGGRLSVGEAARGYSRERHAAWLARRELAS
jgi:hypothetical protein